MNAAGDPGWGPGPLFVPVLARALNEAFKPADDAAHHPRVPAQDQGDPDRRARLTATALAASGAPLARSGAPLRPLPDPFLASFLGPLPDQARRNIGPRLALLFIRARFLVALFPSGDLFLCAKHLFVEARTGAGCSNHAARATDDQLR